MNFQQDKQVGTNIKRIREERKLTQEQLCAHMQVLGCDITRSALAKIEVGQRHIYVGEIKAFCLALQTSYEKLFA